MTGKSKPVPLSDRVRASEARKIAGGGRRMPGGVLPQAAAQKLDLLLEAGYATSAMAVIVRALDDVKV